MGLKLMKLRWVVSISLILYLCSTSVVSAEDLTVVPDTFVVDLVAGDTVTKSMVVSWDGEISVAADMTTNILPDGDGITVTYSVGDQFVVNPGDQTVMMTIEASPYLMSGVYTITTNISIVSGYTSDCPDCPDRPNCSDCPDCPSCGDSFIEKYNSLKKQYDDLVNETNSKIDSLNESISYLNTEYDNLKGHNDYLLVQCGLLLLMTIVASVAFMVMLFMKRGGGGTPSTPEQIQPDTPPEQTPPDVPEIVSRS